MRSVRSVLTVLAAGALVFGGASAASADVTVTVPEGNNYNLVFGDWFQFAADDIFNAGHDNTVGSNN
ncbi:hypothetical protein ACWGHM_10160 [Streptomyces sp. NPDC054904]|uniref:hypothetical protein n=1 Tax=unclassified Streptomyces TaxID=2593676 RepID=UPI002481DA8C|nr:MULTISPECIES: hypothetical protein [unclassified Streptomyces]MDA5283993.1 hypothetical protein [Streptomyces sp. Isolate_45]MDX2390610.1 hypothetical protein [Streptomyces sp. DK15]